MAPAKKTRRFFLLAVDVPEHRDGDTHALLVRDWIDPDQLGRTFVVPTDATTAAGIAIAAGLDAADVVGQQGDK